ncbi:MAG: hypothetical protein IRZ08_16590 [Frankia sp.]|nr:hypothetical protein [Frankia sp.]
MRNPTCSRPRRPRLLLLGMTLFLYGAATAPETTARVVTVVARVALRVSVGLAAFVVAL